MRPAIEPPRTFGYADILLSNMTFVNLTRAAQTVSTSAVENVPSLMFGGVNKLALFEDIINGRHLLHLFVTYILCYIVEQKDGRSVNCQMRHGETESEWESLLYNPLASSLESDKIFLHYCQLCACSLSLTSFTWKTVNFRELLYLILCCDCKSRGCRPF